MGHWCTMTGGGEKVTKQALRKAAPAQISEQGEGKERNTRRFLVFLKGQQFHFRDKHIPRSGAQEARWRAGWRQHRRGHSCVLETAFAKQKAELLGCLATFPHHPRMCSHSPLSQCEHQATGILHNQKRNIHSNCSRKQGRGYRRKAAKA